MQNLIDYLASKQAGPIPDTTDLDSLLADSWDEFDGGHAEGMANDKLYDRIKDVAWNPPILSFTIERHGGTVLGSTRAERHQWDLNIEERTASCHKVGHKQLQPMQPKLDVSPMAEEIAQLIIDRKEDSRLQWKEDGSVAVRIGRILPNRSAAKATLDGRRKQFRKSLEKLLGDIGWQKVRSNVYAPPATHQSHV